LDPREVGSFTLRETILAVKLELSGDDGVLSPAVEVQRGLSQNEGTSVRDGGVIEVTIGEIPELSKDGGVNTSNGGILGDSGATKVGLIEGVLGTVPVSSETRRDVIVKSTSIVEETTGINEGTRVSSDGSGASESVDSIGEGINGIGVVEGLGTKDLEQSTVALEGGAVVNVGIGLDNPDELLAGVVEVDLDLVGRRSDRLITSVLELLNEVLMGVLGHLSALIGIQEDEINVDRSGNKGLLVGRGDSLGSSTGNGSQVLNSPQALANRSEINVNLDLVILYITYTPPFGVFISISVLINVLHTETLLGSRLYLKPSSELIKLLRPNSV
jgi:hypothetical protein